MEKRRLRLQKARSHDLDQDTLREAQQREHGGHLLRQAIKGNVLAKRAALKNQSTVESVTSDDGTYCPAEDCRSPLTSSNSCVTGADDDKFLWDNNRNGSTALL